MKKGKKLLALFISAAVAATMAGCSNSQTTKEAGESQTVQSAAEDSRVDVTADPVDEEEVTITYANFNASGG